MSAKREANAMKTNEIEITRNGSVISKHPDGVVCTYDVRLNVSTNSSMSNDFFALGKDNAGRLLTIAQRGVDEPDRA